MDYIQWVRGRKNVPLSRQSDGIQQTIPESSSSSSSYYTDSLKRIKSLLQTDKQSKQHTPIKRENISENTSDINTLQWDDRDENVVEFNRIHPDRNWPLNNSSSKKTIQNEKSSLDAPSTQCLWEMLYTKTGELYDIYTQSNVLAQLHKKQATKIETIHRRINRTLLYFYLIMTVTITILCSSNIYSWHKYNKNINHIDSTYTNDDDNSTQNLLDNTQRYDMSFWIFAYTLWIVGASCLIFTDVSAKCWHFHQCRRLRYTYVRARIHRQKYNDFTLLRDSIAHILCIDKEVESKLSLNNEQYAPPNNNSDTQYSENIQEMFQVSSLHKYDPQNKHNLESIKVQTQSRDIPSLCAHMIEHYEKSGKLIRLSIELMCGIQNDSPQHLPEKPEKLHYIDHTYYSIIVMLQTILDYIKDRHVLETRYQVPSVLDQQ